MVTESRPVSTRDGHAKLFATDDERFRDARPSPVKGETPAGWQALPATQMRLLNYRFGIAGSGEVWVSISQGGVRENVNRWLGQFGSPALDEEGISKLRQVELAGHPGVWVEAAGDYNGGMGAARKEGQALAGVVALINGQIVTVKMVGPESDVAEQKAALEAYAKNLKLVNSH